MSLEIHHFVMHHIRESENGEALIHNATTCFVKDQATLALASQIQQQFVAKASKGVGAFADTHQPDTDTQDNQSDETTNDDSHASSFAELLNNGLDSSESFYAFSVEATQQLAQIMNKVAHVEAGFVVFSHYQYLATDYLFVGILETQQHVQVNAALELVTSQHLNLSKLEFAARIDLTQLKVQGEQSRYISFIKGRMGRKISDFFMHFLGCEEHVDVKVQNKQLINNVENYLAHEQLDKHEKNTSLENVQQYYKSQIATGAPIKVDEISACLPKNEDAGFDFSAFNAQLDAPNEAQFDPDSTVVRKLAKFSGQGGGVSIAFDRKLLGDRVHYDPITDTLVVKGIPPNLKDQLSKA